MCKAIARRSTFHCVCPQGRLLVHVHVCSICYNAGLVCLQVDYYGAPTPLKQIANLSAPESSLLVIQPYDKSSIQSIEKAIMSSDLNLTPNNDGNLIRINVPQLTAVRHIRTYELQSQEESGIML